MRLRVTKAIFRRLTESARENGNITGALAYLQDEPLGEELLRVWFVVCLVSHDQALEQCLNVRPELRAYYESLP